jgi:hypothetical protein
MNFDEQIVVERNIMESDIAKSMDVLVSALNNDESYRYSWQANIAVAFQDACRSEGIAFPQLHAVSNEAAKNFLNILCRDRK